jgi:hypothetical protein
MKEDVAVNIEIYIPFLSNYTHFLAHHKARSEALSEEPKIPTFCNFKTSRNYKKPK